MSDTSTSSGGGIGFAGALTIAFIVLKLTGVIDWSWWWVLSPLWIAALVAIVGLAVLFIVMYLMERRKERRAREYRLRMRMR